MPGHVECGEQRGRSPAFQRQLSDVGIIANMKRTLQYSYSTVTAIPTLWPASTLLRRNVDVLMLAEQR